MQNDLPQGQTFLPNILVIDADQTTADGLHRAFAAGEMRIEPVLSGKAATLRIADGDFDLVTVDLDLPDIQGLDLLRLILAQSDKPVIVVTARPTKVASVLCLELGADDYVMKPADPDELTARIRAVLRRCNGEHHALQGLAEASQAPLSGKIEFAGWQFDSVTSELISPHNEKVHITTMEASLLGFFLRNARRTLDRTLINQNVHGANTAFDERSVDVLVKKLRAKLAECEPDLVAIRTVRGAGYMFCLDAKPVLY